MTVAGRPMNAWCVADSCHSHPGARADAWFRRRDRFDVLAFGSSDPSHEDQKGMLAAVRAIDELVRAEVAAGVPEHRVVVGGFSQGATEKEENWGLGQNH